MKTVPIEIACEDVDWSYLAQDWIQLAGGRFCVHDYEPQFPYKTENFLAS